jgi:hypothetical protein
VAQKINSCAAARLSNSCLPVLIPTFLIEIPCIRPVGIRRGDDGAMGLTPNLITEGSGNVVNMVAVLLYGGCAALLGVEVVGS